MFDHVAKLKEYIRCDSVSADPAFAPGMQRCREFVAGMLRELGLKVEIVPTEKQPIVMARREGPASWPHVIIYGHYDVQPPDPLNLWTSQPFEPEIRGERIYGRGSADNKGPFLVHVTALAHLLAENPSLPLRVTMVVEGEEEIGSPSFHGFIEKHRDKLQGDLFLLSDTGIPSPDQIVITCGLRGIVTGEVEIVGPKGDLHSGLHGGVLLNPIQALAEVLSTLHTPDGRVNISGYYDAVLGVEPWERDELQRLGTSVAQYQEFLGIPRFHTPPGFDPFEATRFQPTLEFNGIGGGYQGAGSKTVIPSRAFAKISCRLVSDQDPDAIWALVERALHERCPKGVSMTVTKGHQGPPYVVVPPGRSNTPKGQSPVLATAFAAAEEGVTKVFGKPPLFLREGGSIPIIADIKRVLGLDSVLMGMFLPEDNLHAPNESFNLSVMARGIEVSKHIMARLAGLAR
ncbi:MAG: M20/M25/M40 family metallo-hydrolase [Opitutaceae bacterium]|nr:M20/M25/M40 family metallo-hydrolase [Opitutaceae bacterium]